jgi:hypothetical protein
VLDGKQKSSLGLRLHQDAEAWALKARDQALTVLLLSGYSAGRLAAVRRWYVQMHRLSYLQQVLVDGQASVRTDGG